MCCRGCIPSSAATSSSLPLSSLFPVGTIKFLLRRSVSSETSCGNCSHEEDGWHLFDLHDVLGLVELADDRDFLSLLWSRLVSCNFLRITYTIRGLFLILRNYLVPHDLPSLRGALRDEKKLAQARPTLKRLLLRLNTNPASWEGAVDASGRLMAHDPDTLGKVYASVPSPSPNGGPGFAGRLLDFDDDLEDLGMKTTLFRYQRRSVSAMLEIEAPVRYIPDPLFIPLPTVNGRRCLYIQPGTLELLQERPLTSTTRGGILCEELGSGKTVMILTLISTTLEELPAPALSLSEEPTIMTSLSRRHFPLKPASYARTRSFPTLVELLLHRSRTMPLSLSDRSRSQIRFSDHERLNTLRRAVVPFYLEAPLQLDEGRRSSRAAAPRRLYLSPATLIIVPNHLMLQWTSEITKHCSDSLRVLVVRPDVAMPTPCSLASDFDIVLMPYPRLHTESSQSDLPRFQNALRGGICMKCDRGKCICKCKCPTLPGSRVPDCSCYPAGVSPLLQVRWKRLVIDEGQNSADKSSVLYNFTQLMSIERKWTVTGTPTTNLLGLGLGVQATHDATDIEGDSDDGDGIDSPTIDPEEDFVTNVEDGDVDEELTYPDEDEAFPKRRWNKFDREDLRKLGVLVKFLDLPLSRDFQKYVAAPLLDSDGPFPGSVEVLRQVMQSVMIRHRVEDIEQEAVLPPMEKHVIQLDLDPIQIKTYNAFQAVIAVNAIDSEREDQDYLFHKANTKHLNLVVQNMIRTNFWAVDSEFLYNVDQRMRERERDVQTAIKRGAPQEDIDLLTDAITHSALAGEDREWRAVQQHSDHHIPFRVAEMTEDVYKAWCRAETGETCTASKFLHADRIIELRKLVKGRPLINAADLAVYGQVSDSADQQQEILAEELLRKKQDKSSYPVSQSKDQPTSAIRTLMPHQTGENRQALKDARKKAIEEMQAELRGNMERLKRLEQSVVDGALGTLIAMPARRTESSPLSPLVASSPIARVKILNSASSKLNYIINEVLTYSRHEKILIFSSFDYNLRHVAEALQLVQVDYMYFSTDVKPREREQFVLTFETSDKYRVFLMALRHGARGLNIISASRVIFCEPVWQADVESQAIKRVHRIGQTRPITVKTLVIRGTAEEAMMEQRKLLQDGHAQTPKSVIEEAGMRHYIANPKFITEKPTELPQISIPLFDLAPDATFTSTSTSFHSDGSTASSSIATPLRRVQFSVADPIPKENEERPVKKRKVMFVNP
ncbi:hypothetical protein FISHEDRAFT_37708 [Fistulina hepatica ATCC 64428]|nr:hypothetical protein FISHEDRAFT_37708 [Fistulina hepatica ATCC 64428]